MLSYFAESLFFPFLTSTIFVLLVYAIFVVKKLLEASRQKNRALPNVERLKQSLPLTVSTSWKLGGLINSVAIWENHVFSSGADNGVIACQAVIQAPAQVVMKELSEPRIFQMIHPLICDAFIAPGIAANQQSNDAQVNSDVSIEINIPSMTTLSNIYLKWKNTACLKRHWKFTKEGPSWLVVTPEYKLHENLFGVWQCMVAVDILSEGNTSDMSLIAIFAAPNNSGTILSLKHTIAHQIICIREHIDSLYLKKIFRKDTSATKHHSTLLATEEKSNAITSKANMHKSGKSLLIPTPTESINWKEGNGKEERGFVETPAEISTMVKAFNSKNGGTQNGNLQVADEKINIYKDIISDAFKSLIQVYDADETTPGWSYLGNRNGIEIYRLQGDAQCPSDCFKGTVEVKVPLSYALQYCTNIDYKKEWDDVFNDDSCHALVSAGKTVEELDEVTKVVYMEYKPVWPTTARDFCSISATRHIKGNIYAMAVKAATHPLCPPVKGKQRAEIIVGGFVVECVTEDPPLCKVTYVTRADLKGKIPASLVNKVNEKQPMYTGIIREKMEERYMYQDPPDEGNCKILATRRHESIIEKPPSVKQFDANDPEKECKNHSLSHTGQMEDASITAERDFAGQDSTDAISSIANKFRELSKEEMDELNADDGDVQWDNMSQSSVSSLDQSEFQENAKESQSTRPLAEQNLQLPRDRFGNIDFKTLGNQTAAKLLEEVLVASKTDSKSRPPENPDQLEEWTYQGTMKNVVVLRKIHSDSNFYSFLGRGIINVLPVTVWAAVKNPSTRFVYDNMLKKTRVVREIDEGSKIIHMRHETTACFVKQARDFLVLTSERADPGKYIIAGVSVEVPECPIERNCVRGKVLASGWIIEPVLRNGKPCSLVTYLSQVDFGGKLPIRLINLIAKRQPMSIAYLRSYLESAEHRM